MQIVHYLDTARLGLMTPAARDRQRELTEFAGTDAASIQMDRLLGGGGDSLDRAFRDRFPSLASFGGLSRFRKRLATSLSCHPDQSLMFGTSSATHIRAVASLFFGPCGRVLTTDLAWPPYRRFLTQIADQRGQEISVIPVRCLIERPNTTMADLSDIIVSQFHRQNCDGLFLTSVSHDGIRIPAGEITERIRRESELSFSVIDGSQEFGQVNHGHSVVASDMYLTSAHKWLGAYPTGRRSDVIDWAGMPEGTCNMNFRVPDPIAGNARSASSFMQLTSLAAGCATCVILTAMPFLSSSISLPLGCVLVAGLAASQFLQTKVGPLALACRRPYFALTGIVAIAFLTTKLQHPLSIRMIALIAAFGLTIWLADQMATLFVYWLSASPKLNSDKMHSVREIWHGRFVPPDVCEFDLQPLVEIYQSVRTVSSRINYLLFGLVLILVSAVSFASQPTLGGVALLGLLIAGAAVLLAMHYSDDTFLSTSWRAIRFYLEYLQGRFLPVWCCKSPVGKSIYRQATFVAVVIVLSFTATSLLGFNHASGETNPLRRWIIAGGTNAAISCGFAVPAIFVTTAFVYGPPLTVIQAACEGATATLANSEQSEFDAYVDRIQSSANEAERDSIWMGFHVDEGFPILVAIDLFFEHYHVVGSTGSGKTSLGLSSLVAQLIRRGDGPVIVVDGKGDQSFFHSTKIWTEQVNRKFKWFTNKHNKPTYVFNPLDQSHIDKLTLQEIVGLFLSAFNLNHGDDYGRAWFAAVAKAAMMLSVKESREKRPTSFQEFQRTVEKVMAENKEFKTANHLLFVMRSLAEFEQLNLSSKTNQHPACRHSIHMPEVIKNCEVAYFCLESLTDPTSTGEISRLVTYSAIAAAAAYKEEFGKTPSVYLIIDEAQHVIAKNIAGVLEQARDNGLACVLSHQTRSQLNPPGGVDLREVVDNCTCIKQFFAVRDPDSRKFLSDISGEVGYHRSTWQQFAGDVRRGAAGKGHAVGFDGERAIASVTEFTGPRLTDADISEINHQEHLAALAVERYEGLTRFRGAFPIYIDYPISKDQYDERREKMRWPTLESETIDTGQFWPAAEKGETIVSTPNADEFEFQQGLSLEDLEQLKSTVFNRRRKREQ